MDTGRATRRLYGGTGGVETIYWQAADGTGAPERLSQGPGIQVPNSFSPDGRQLIFSQPDAPPWDLGVVTLAGERRVELLLRAPYNEQNGEISPDGRRTENLPKQNEEHRTEREHEPRSSGTQKRERQVS